MGEPAGIGGEIALKAWARLAEYGPVFFVIDDSLRLARLAGVLGIAAQPIPIAHPFEAQAAFRQGLPVLETIGRVKAAIGRPCAATADAVIASIAQSVELVRRGEAAALCTDPIQKSL
jgi:4-hydroxythreonine-4-phosphate dehydrogenase